MKDLIGYLRWFHKRVNMIENFLSKLEKVENKKGNKKEIEEALGYANQMLYYLFEETNKHILPLKPVKKMMGNIADKIKELQDKVK